ncbi:unnamed protein product [Rotaria sp. Silwood1]|nr:unnamed protein product [Rotaria sp. Silwood1]
MLSNEPSHSRFKKRNNQNKKRSHFHHNRIHDHPKWDEYFSKARTNISSNAERSQSSKNLTDQEIQQRQLIQQYIFSKLGAYVNKSRLWQLTHSSHIKRRLLDESAHIADIYSLTKDFVYESINQLFTHVDNYVLKLHRLIQNRSDGSVESNVLFQKTRESNNHWGLLQLQRAKQIFPNINNEEFTDDELLQKYYNHIIETLTPKPDTASSNCIAQLREQPFDLNHAYEQAENKGREVLGLMLENYRKRSIPNLGLIQEMIDLGFEHMKRAPTKEDFEDATNFITKISLLHKTKQTYESGLHNVADEFMISRFGKVFGANALPTTAHLNKQFIYLIHLFLKSISQLIMMIHIERDDNEEIISIINTVIGKLFATKENSSLIKLNNDDLFSPKLNIDQWTWLFEKWRDALRTFPMMLTKVGAFGRLLRTTLGVGIACLFSFAETIVNNNQKLDSVFVNEELFRALQMGFYFGIAYAIVDCVQDEIQNSNNISSQHFAVLNIEQNENGRLLTLVEILDKWILIMENLLSGGEFNRQEIPKTPLTPLLLETFDSLIALTKSIGVTRAAFNDLALLLRSQRMDKKTTENFYDDEELYLGAMLKSHFSYTCIIYMANIQSTPEESERLWMIPFVAQLTDDCRDFYEDFQSNSVTSFTHYASFIGRQQSSHKNLLNPFYVFLYSCCDMYLLSGCDMQTGAFVGRRIARTLRSIEINLGASALREFLYLFCGNNLPLHDYFWIYVRSRFSNVTDPEKSLIRVINKASIKYARTNRKLETYICDHLKQVEDALHIHAFNKNKKSLSVIDRDEQLLISAMNYSVTAGGKRLRPLLMMMVSDLYNLELKNVLPLACGMEYLHTSSLILDDLPAQDNSDLRRGRPTLHKAVIDDDIPENLCEGRAQLAAVDLIAISMSVINHDLVKNGFSPECVNQVVTEISLSMHDLCIGQMMDLRAAHMGMERKNELLDELDHIAWFKTGKAIEIVLITPAILAMSFSSSLSSSVNVQSINLNSIRELGRLMGILFQMRDDLLDVEGENIGKPAALDVKNNTVTYVSVLGAEGTRQRLKEFRQQTLKLVNECWPSGAGTIKDVVNYIVDRKN